jgi:N-acetylglutamate synthase
LKIRTFEPSDYRAARALWERTEGVGLSAADEPEAIRTYLKRNPGMSFVVVDGELVGTVLCGHDGRRGLIHHLVTAPGHRRRGIGTALLRHGLEALRREGIDKCHLLVYRSNEAGLSFWRKVGAEERASLAIFSIATS